MLAPLTQEILLKNTHMTGERDSTRPYNLVISKDMDLKFGMLKIFLIDVEEKPQYTVGSRM